MRRSCLVQAAAAKGNQPVTRQLAKSLVRLRQQVRHPPADERNSRVPCGYTYSHYALRCRLICGRAGGTSDSIACVIGQIDRLNASGAQLRGLRSDLVVRDIPAFLPARSARKTDCNQIACL